MTGQNKEVVYIEYFAKFILCYNPYVTEEDK